MSQDRKTTNRLERSTGAKYLTIPDIVKFCNDPSHPISYTDSQQSITKTAPNKELREDFEKCYTLDSLPSTTLREQGASPVIVFEHKLNPLSNHGEVCAAIAKQVGASLAPAVDSLFMHGAVNPNYRKNIQGIIGNDPIKDLLENQGIPVINTSIGWQDASLGFEQSNPEQANHLWKVTAFLADAAGNDGRFGTDGKTVGAQQKHNSISHFAPLVVHVGAAELLGNDKNNWVVPGYSSANSPTFLAPAPNKLKVQWADDDVPKTADATSAAAPYAAGVLAALNNRYGSYLTREQILYAVIATCKPIKEVKRYAYVDKDTGETIEKTPQDKELEYKKNSAGLAYNPEYGGFGLIDPHKADRLLCHMVDISMSNSDGITVPTEQLVTMLNCKKHQAETRDNNGNKIYQYKVKCEDGIALKTTLEADFANEHGDITITSPSGTTVPMVMSKLRDKKTGSIIGTFSLSTSHAWAGEQLGGEWIISSTKQLNRLRLNQDHFQSKDIVKDINNEKLAELISTPAPYMSLASAVPLVDRVPELRVSYERTVPKHGITVGKYELADSDDIVAFTRQLFKAPSGFLHNYATPFKPPFFNSNDPEGVFEIESNRIKALLDKAPEEDKDNIRYSIIKNKLAAVDVYKAQGKELHQIIPLCRASENYLACISARNPEEKLNAEEAVIHYKKALAICENLGVYDKAYEIAGGLHNAMSRCIEQGEEKYNAQLAEIRQKALEFSKILHGNSSTIDNDAISVAAGEFLFSTNERLGSYNTRNSMTIIAKDSVTGKTGLLHLADDTDPKILNKFFEKLGSKSAEIRLIGVHSGGKAIEKYHDFIKNNSDRTDTIISADILGKHDIPRAVVVDPNTFKIFETVPAKNRTTEIAYSEQTQSQHPQINGISQNQGNGFF